MKTAHIPLLFMPVFLVLSDYIYFIQIHEYGFWHAEAIYLLLGSVLVGLCCGICLLQTKGIYRVTLLAILLVFFLGFFPLFHKPYATSILMLVSIVLSFYLLETLPAIICIASVVFMLSCFLLPMQKPLSVPITTSQVVKVNESLPTIVHIVLDEHIGINAIPKDIAGGVALKQSVLAFYKQYGFTIFPNAYSHYARTYDSLSNLLNFTPQSQDLAYFPKGIDILRLKQNKAFLLFSKQGYAIHVMQPDYMDYCHASGANIERCTTYPVHSLQYVRDLPLSTTQRTFFLAKSFLLSTTFYMFLNSFYSLCLQQAFDFFSIELPYLAWNQNQTSVLAVPALFDQLATDIISHPQGRVYFAHLLLPHSPYIFNKTCGPNPNTNDWLINYDLGKGNTRERRTVRYRLYEAQLTCEYALLRNFFERLKKAGIYDNLIFIIDGDHSARLPLTTPYVANQQAVTWQDFEDSYATLFAEKSPGGVFHMNEKQAAINDLYAKVISEILKQPLPKDLSSPYVFLVSEDPEQRLEMQRLAVTEFKQ